MAQGLRVHSALQKEDPSSVPSTQRGHFTTASNSSCRTTQPHQRLRAAALTTMCRSKHKIANNKTNTLKSSIEPEWESYGRKQGVLECWFLAYSFWGYQHIILIFNKTVSSLRLLCRSATVCATKAECSRHWEVAGGSMCMYSGVVI